MDLPSKNSIDDEATQIQNLKSYVKKLVTQMNEKELRLKSLQKEYDEYVHSMDQAYSGIEQVMNNLNSEIKELKGQIAIH